MKPDKLTIYQLFEAQRRHVVPLFQRPYVWERERHWAPLWEDIARQAEASGRRERVRPHFLGAVVLNQLPIVSRDIDTREIIDGQQRMTTLQVFLAAAKRVAEARDDQRLCSEFERLTINPLLTDRDDHFKIRPTKADQPVFAAVMASPPPEDIVELFTPEGQKKPILPRLAEAYLFFLDQLKDYIEDHGSANPEDRFWEVHSALRDRLLTLF